MFMNTIICTKNCMYQKDGYCNLTYSYSINNPNNDCPYFCNKNNSNFNFPKPSIMDNITKTT